MNSKQERHHPGQTTWLDNIARDITASGTLKRYIDKLPVTGLTSNPSINNKEIVHRSSCHGAIGVRIVAVHTDENAFFGVAPGDITTMRNDAANSFGKSRNEPIAVIAAKRSGSGRDRSRR